MRTDDRSRRGLGIAVAILAAASTLAFSRPAQGAIEGRWIAEFDEDRDRVQLTTKRGSARVSPST